MADYLALEEQQTSFDRVAAYNYGGMFLESGDEVERVSAMPLTWAYPELLGLQPLVGRVFEAGDGRVGAEATALISHGFWMRKMGGDPAALGRPIRLNDRAYTVIGVLPSQMGPLEHSREVFPILQFDTPSRKGPFFLHIVGRLGEDVDAAAAAAELRAINRRIFPIWESSYPDERASWGMQDLREAVVGEVGRPLAVALGAVAFVLLIASVNAANLLLARVVRQRRALAVRAALGATRFRLARQLITESGLLGMAGGILGIAVAAGLLRLVEVFGADYIPRLQEVGLQGPSWGFAVVVTAASSLLFGLVPALEGSRPGLERDLGSQGRANTEGARPRRLRKALVALEFAVAVPLLVGAGLMLASFSNLAAVDPGFRTENILTVGVEFRMSRYPRMSDVRAFWDEALPRLAALPGVGAAGLANGRPPNQYPMSNNFNLLDRPTPPTESQPAVPWVAINPEYFQVLGVPLLQGRMLRETAEDADIEVMVDNTWARRFYPGEDPLGRRFTSGGCDGPECSRLVVVGVVGDVKYAGLGDSSQGTVYTLQRLNPTNWTYLFARTERDPDLVLPSIREVLRARDAQLPLFSVSTIDDLMAENLQSPLHASALAGALAVVALLLAAT